MHGSYFSISMYHGKPDNFRQFILRNLTYTDFPEDIDGIPLSSLADGVGAYPKVI